MNIIIETVGDMCMSIRRNMIILVDYDALEEEDILAPDGAASIDL